FIILQIVEREVSVSLFAGTKNIGDYYLSTPFLTIAIFVIVLRHKNFGKNTIISKFGRNAVGIYVAHLIIISSFSLLFNFFDWVFLRNYIWFNFIFTIVVFVLSYYFFLVFNKVIYKMSQLLSSKIQLNKKWHQI